MKLPRYPLTNATAKAGVNFVRMVVETSNSIFTEIPQENDLGIDGLIEVIEGEYPTGNCLAVQIKSGNSFFSKKNNECHIPIESHARYWLNYPLPVIGIVYVPERSCGYWVNIKKFIQDNTQSNKITFQCSKTNIFNLDNFTKVFIPMITGSLPNFTLEEALELFKSMNNEEHYIGLIVLFRKYSDKEIVWDSFIKYFRENEVSKISSMLIYYLAHIPWHPDIFGGNDKITKKSREFAQSLINSFGKDDVIKLLCIIDENGLIRGSIGQSVEAIIASIPERKSLFSEISKDQSLPIEIREWVDIFRMYRPNRY